jgi:hypothetical protein
MIVSYNGSSRATSDGTDIAPGEPMQDGFVESFNGSPI